MLLKDVMGDGNKLFDMVAPDTGAPFALLAAAEAGDEPRVASLLQSQADVNARDERGWSPLIMAAKEGHTSLLRLLLAVVAVVALKFGLAAVRRKRAALDAARAAPAMLRGISAAGI